MSKNIGPKENEIEQNKLNLQTMSDRTPSTGPNYNHCELQ